MSCLFSPPSKILLLLKKICFKLRMGKPRNRLFLLQRSWPATYLEVINYRVAFFKVIRHGGLLNSLTSVGINSNDFPVWYLKRKQLYAHTHTHVLTHNTPSISHLDKFNIPHLSQNENHYSCQALLASHHFICSHLYLMLLSTVQQKSKQTTNCKHWGNSNKHESFTIIQPSCSKLV